MYCILLIIIIRRRDIDKKETEKESLGPIETGIAFKYWNINGFRYRLSDSHSLADSKMQCMWSGSTVQNCTVFSDQNLCILYNFHMAQNIFAFRMWMIVRWFDIRHIPIEMKWQTTCHTILPQSKLTADRKWKGEKKGENAILYIYNNIIGNNSALTAFKNNVDWLFMQMITYRFGFEFLDLQLQMNNGNGIESMTMSDCWFWHVYLVYDGDGIV